MVDRGTGRHSGDPEAHVKAQGPPIKEQNTAFVERIDTLSSPGLPPTPTVQNRAQENTNDPVRNRWVSSLVSRDRNKFSSEPKPTVPPALHQNPTPAYSPSPIASLSFVDSLASASRTLSSTHTIPPRSGYAWKLSAGQICRITTPAGPQVGDLNLWNVSNPRERFWAARTRQLHASHVSVGDRLWSCLPYLRPMVTITGDSVGKWRYGVDGKDEHGGRCHDLLGTR